MNRLFRDTAPEVEQVIVEGFRGMPVHEKFRRVTELTEFIRRLALTELSNRYPDATEAELKLRLASRSIPADLMRRAFQWNTETKGY